MIFESSSLTSDTEMAFGDPSPHKARLRDFGSRLPFAAWRRLHSRLLTPQLVGDFTAGDPPVPIPNTEVKPRRADCTARESVWESRSLPALNKGHVQK